MKRTFVIFLVLALIAGACPMPAHAVDSEAVYVGLGTFVNAASWEELLDQYVRFGVHGFAGIPEEQCLSVMAETVFDNRIIWVGLLDERDVELIDCDYTVIDSTISDSKVVAEVNLQYTVLQNGVQAELVTQNTITMTCNEAGAWYIQQDVRQDGMANAVECEIAGHFQIGLNDYSTDYPNTWTNTGDQAKDITQIALSQVGYRENADHTKYNAWFYGRDQAAAWCAIFISWCANQANVDTSVIKKNALASGFNVSNMSSNSFGAPAYAFGSVEPKLGDIIYVNNDSDSMSDHVGLICQMDDNYIYAVEGNYSQKVSKVKYDRSTGKCYDGTILFYARPNYQTPPTYMDGCVSYPCHVSVTTDDAYPLWSLPCSNVTTSESSQVGKTAAGDELTATALYYNTKKNYWYKVSYNGKDCYLYCGNATTVSRLYSDVTISGVKAPSVLTKGSSFVIGGTISSQYSRINTVGVYVTDPWNIYLQCQDTVNGKNYSLAGSKLDQQLTFGSLSAGTYYYDIDVTVENYYSNDGKNRSGGQTTFSLHSSMFDVVEKSTEPVKDTTAPSIQNETVTDITPDGYSISCTVTDNVDVERVQIASWTADGDQDDLLWTNCCQNGSTYSCRVMTADHDKESGTYYTDIYAYDSAGNCSIRRVSAQVPVAYDGTCGANLKWKVDDTGTLTIFGTDAMTEFSGYTDVPWYTQRSSIRAVTIESGVTSIGSYAFYGCDGITSIVIPEGVTSIGYHAFYCDSLTDITIPRSVTAIGMSAFFECSSLTNVYISDLAAWCEIEFDYVHFGFVTEDSNPLYYADNLYLNQELVTNLRIPDGITSIGTAAFCGYNGLKSVTIPASVTSIGKAAFRSCTALESLYISDLTAWCGIEFGSEEASGLFTYTESVYIDNTLTTELRIPDGVTSIGAYAFSGYPGLTKVTIPEGVTTIGVSAFKTCWDLKSVTISNTVSSIGEDAFYNCMHLAEITVDEHNPNYASVDGVLYNKDKTVLIRCPGGKNGKHTVPATVSRINQKAFAFCNWLTEVVFTGDAPEFSADAFNYTWVKAYYPVNNGTWTEELLQNYGGTVTWVAFDESGSITGTCGTHAAWELTEYGTLIISGTGPMDEFDSTSAVPWNDNAASITAVVIEEGITSIGPAAFFGCSNLTNVTLPDSVVSIGNSAFNRCTSLAGIVLPDGITEIGNATFEKCENLKTITIPDGVASIGSSAFYGCSSLTEITLPDSVTKIGSSAFRDCSSLVAMEIPRKVTDINGSTFEDCTSLVSVEIPYGVTSIGNVSFAGCTSLTAVTIPGSVETVWGYAFSGCSSLSRLVIENGVGRINEYAFYNCNLVEVSIPASVVGIGGAAFLGNSNLIAIHVDPNNPGYTSDASGALYDKNQTTLLQVPAQFTGAYRIADSVKEIENFAFSGCAGLVTVQIPTGVTSIGMSAFNGCSSLTEISIPYGVNTIENYTFNECTSLENVELPNSVTSIGTKVFYGCSSLKTIVIPRGVTVIKNNTFYNCSSLETVELPDSMTSIGEYAFYGCSSLRTIEIPCGVTSIEEDTFNHCSSLEQVVLPESVTSICSYAFYNCSSLRDITIPRYVTSIGSLAFYNCSSLPGIMIPSGVKTIEYGVFEYCGSMENVVLPEGLTSVGNSAFFACKSLNGLKIPASVTEIGSQAFYNCSSLTEVSIPANVVEIGDEAFSGCSSLVAIRADRNNPNYTSDASGALYNKNQTTLLQVPARFTGDYWVADSVKEIEAFAFRDCSSLEHVELPDGLTNIGAYAFYGCSSLTDIAIPHGVTAIKEYTFCKCNSITDVAIPDSVTSIGQYAFYGCTSLAQVAIPEHVTTLELAVFYDCSGLTDIDIPKTVTSIGAYAFRGCTGLSDVMIPESVTVIGTAAFAKCTGLDKIIFLGGAPVFADAGSGSNVFSDVTATAYRPIEEQSWTDENMVDYGGKITWIAYRAGEKPWENHEPTEPDVPMNPFADVPEGTFYYDPVMWAIENGITNGTSATTFGPNDQCMRAHVVTFLWRAMGSPEPKLMVNPFVDVKPTDFYYKPVLWALENGITSGMDATHFGPTSYCNRAQVVTFLYRTMGTPELDSMDNPFTDVQAGAFYEKPVLWAVQNGITNGLSATSFGPNAICNRAQIVTFLYRAFVND